MANPRIFACQQLAPASSNDAPAWFLLLRLAFSPCLFLVLAHRALAGPHEKVREKGRQRPAQKRLTCSLRENLRSTAALSFSPTHVAHIRALCSSIPRPSAAAGITMTACATSTALLLLLLFLSPRSTRPYLFHSSCLRRE